ncbi:hypothetical protein VTK26DRAFT_9508 [Humicola hyalothermophila]
MARSDTTYHSFQDLELPEPEVSSQHDEAPQPMVCLPPAAPRSRGEERPSVREMRRQDSGYASIDGQDSHSSCRKDSSTSVSSSTRPRRSRQSNHTRATKSRHSTRRSRNGRHPGSPPGTARSLPQSHHQQPVTYFHFPHFTSSDPSLDESPRQLSGDPRDSAPTMSSPNNNETPYSIPPQTTHYWTSDQTRRLEYAAIDAASKGVRGWVMRHVVPEFFVPQSKRRIGFEDDRGSVVRYRLELESDEGTTGEGTDKAESVRAKGWRGWWFGMRRR